MGGYLTGRISYSGRGCNSKTGIQDGGSEEYGVGDKNDKGFRSVRGWIPGNVTVPGERSCGKGSIGVPSGKRKRFLNLHRTRLVG